MPLLKEKAIVLLGSEVAGMQNGDGKSIAYTVPPGKKAIPDHVVIRDPSGSLDSGGTGDFDLGTGAGADTWVTATDLDTLTAVTDSIKIPAPAAKTTILAAGDEFGIKPVTGATLDVTATVEVWGHEYDA